MPGMVDAAVPDAFFTPAQRRTIAAAMARIIPTDDTPGAAEAGTVDFVDRYLSGTGFIYARPDGSGFETLGGRSEQAWRSRVGIMRARYIEGIGELDARSLQSHGVAFAGLEAGQQDEVLRAVERRKGCRTARCRLRMRSVARPPRAPRCSRPAPRSISTSLRFWSRIRGRASTQTRSMAATATM